MLLQSLELQGYKTFAGKTSFIFADQITAIVGPNGSGKSNIADSIRWVLGEQSYSLLRGKKTVDMIFSGSENKSRAGMASATITFNNETNWLPIDFSEVAITRRAYRDGTNEYLINHQKVRLKDVTELLGKSGLSERTYTIIGQGLVDAALALKAEERRKLFEEAAGIGLYRSRREEAYRRLDTTQRNLTRVDDILSELRPRLRSLEKQTERTRKYEQLKNDLQILLREWYGYHWNRAQDQLEQSVKNLESRRTSLEQITSENEEVESILLEHRNRIQELRSQLNSWHHQISNLHRQREEISVNLAVTDERIRSNKLSQQNIESQISRYENELDIYQERFKANQQEKEAVEETLTEINHELNGAEERLRDYEEQQYKITQEINALEEKHGHLQHQISEYTVQVDERSKAKTNNLQEISELEVQVESSEQQLQQVKTGINHLNRQINDLEEEQAEIYGQIELQTERFAVLQDKQKSLSQKEQDLTRESAKTDALIQAIENAEASNVGFAEGAKKLLDLASKQAGTGKLLPLIQKMRIPQDIEVAIAAALGEYRDALLIEDTDRIDLYLDSLSESRTRGTILPIKGAVPPDAVELPADRTGIVGIASDLVEIAAEYRLAVDVLLNNVIVVRERSAAKKLLKSVRGSVRIVTLKGEVFHARGPVQAGVGTELATIRRPREKQELLSKMEALESEKTAVQAELDDLDENLVKKSKLLESLENKLESLEELKQTRKSEYREQNLYLTEHQRNIKFYREQIDKLHQENRSIDETILDLQQKKTISDQETQRTLDAIKQIQAQLGVDKRDDIQKNIHHWRTQKALFEEKLAAVKQRLTEIQEQIDELNQEITDSSEKKAVIISDQENKQIQLGELRGQEAKLLSQVDEYQKKIDPAETELMELEEHLSEIQMREDVTRHGLNQAERILGQAELEHTRRLEAIESLRSRIEDDLGLVDFEYTDSISGPTPLPFKGIVERLPNIDVLPDGLEKEVKRQKAQLRRIGPINTEAAKEYEEVLERHEFMVSQIEDLENAERDIRQVISELDKLMERDFLKTFEAVAAEFEDIFQRLFGGGAAKLVLIDPDDLTETGIDIEARLPGRRAQGLSLLSGGERSLTATALVFALLKVSPTPFCVLDEVDAMLDEANVGRFRELLKDLSQNTQFIIITHNRNTVQAADVIYGVTMGKESTSQVISLKMDQYEEILVEEA